MKRRILNDEMTRNIPKRQDFTPAPLKRRRRTESGTKVVLG